VSGEVSYLRIKNFWEYQNADAWKKARKNKGGHKHPAWCKFHCARDQELDAEKPMTRLVFYELLRLSTIYENAILNDISKIAKAISMSPDATRQAIDRLLEVGWLSETKTPRRSREPSRKILHQIEIEKEIKPSRAMRQDVVWEALTEQMGEPVTKSERGRFNRAVKELKEIGAGPEEIAAKCKMYRLRWPNITLTPQALTSNWSILDPLKVLDVVPVEELVDLPWVTEEERQKNLERLATLMGGSELRTL
jgi:hypothetical protein